MADAPSGQVVAGALSVDCHYPKSTTTSDEGLFETIEGTADVGSLRPNPWGLYDMSGNVFQWVADCYVENYSKAPTDGSMVAAGDCDARVVRGGSFDFNPSRVLRSAYRSRGAPVFRYDYVGVRVVRTKR
jgi:formylglycine-generating enzyme required for sulfatase activity